MIKMTATIIIIITGIIIIHITISYSMSYNNINNKL